jgi:hypothetical protein
MVRFAAASQLNDEIACVAQGHRNQQSKLARGMQQLTTVHQQRRATSIGEAGGGAAGDRAAEQALTPR